MKASDLREKAFFINNDNSKELDCYIGFYHKNKTYYEIFQKRLGSVLDFLSNINSCVKIDSQNELKKYIATKTTPPAFSENFEDIVIKNPVLSFVIYITIPFFNLFILNEEIISVDGKNSKYSKSPNFFDIYKNDLLLYCLLSFALILLEVSKSDNLSREDINKKIDNFIDDYNEEVIRYNKKLKSIKNNFQSSVISKKNNSSFKKIKRKVIAKLVDAQKIETIINEWSSFSSQDIENIIRCIIDIFCVTIFREKKDYYEQIILTQYDRHKTDIIVNKLNENSGNSEQIKALLKKLKQVLLSVKHLEITNNINEIRNTINKTIKELDSNRLDISQDNILEIIKLYQETIIAKDEIHRLYIEKILKNQNVDLKSINLESMRLAIFSTSYYEEKRLRIAAAHTVYLEKFKLAYINIFNKKNIKKNIKVLNAAHICYSQYNIITYNKKNTNLLKSLFSMADLNNTYTLTFLKENPLNIK